MGEQRRKKTASDAAKAEAPNLYENFSKCLEGGHISKDSFDVEGKKGISKLHACSQCGLMYWEK